MLGKNYSRNLLLQANLIGKLDEIHLALGAQPGVGIVGRHCDDESGDEQKQLLWASRQQESFGLLLALCNNILFVLLKNEKVPKRNIKKFNEPKQCEYDINSPGKTRRNNGVSVGTRGK